MGLGQSARAVSPCLQSIGPSAAKKLRDVGAPRNSGVRIRDARASDRTKRDGNPNVAARQLRNTCSCPPSETSRDEILVPVRRAG
jgi:hypothetical protein